jgi:hypothetical protein
LLPPGKEFQFIIERDKVDKIRRVIAHNDGEVINETPFQEDLLMKVRKAGPGEVA